MRLAFGRPPDRDSGKLTMIQSIQRVTIVEMLLNSLEAERYVRGPLLLNIVDELSASDAFAPAAEMAKRLLATLEGGRVDERAFHRGLDDLRVCVQRLSRTGLAEPPAEALARTTPRIVTGRPANAA
jgi:hypothetical protein